MFRYLESGKFPKGRTSWYKRQIDVLSQRQRERHCQSLTVSCMRIRGRVTERLVRPSTRRTHRANPHMHKTHTHAATTRTHSVRQANELRLRQCWKSVAV